MSNSHTIGFAGAVDRTLVEMSHLVCLIHHSYFSTLVVASGCTQRPGASPVLKRLVTCSFSVVRVGVASVLDADICALPVQVEGTFVKFWGHCPPPPPSTVICKHLCKRPNDSTKLPRPHIQECVEREKKYRNLFWGHRKVSKTLSLLALSGLFSSSLVYHARRRSTINISNLEPSFTTRRAASNCTFPGLSRVCTANGPQRESRCSGGNR